MSCARERWPGCEPRTAAAATEHSRHLALPPLQDDQLPHVPLLPRLRSMTAIMNDAPAQTAKCSDCRGTGWMRGSVFDARCIRGWRPCEVCGRTGTTVTSR